jgi:diguanylate cyclase (GGDEF)-like protein/PAS domain S-box-containing protein
MEGTDTVIDRNEPPPRHVRVLLVEDQPTMVEWVRQVLAAEPDIELHVCLEASRAAGEARRVQPSLILQDLVMPGTTGFELLAQYHADPDLADIPVVVLSSLADVEEKARAFALCVADYIVKLPNPVEFVARVRAHSFAYATRRELRETKEELRLTLKHAPIGIALVAPDGQWLRVNDALCKIVGYTREDLLASNFQRITHPDDLDADVAQNAQLLQGAIDSYDIKKRYLHRDGRVVWVQLAVSLVRADEGAPRFFISQVQDISERVAAEQAAAKQSAIVRAVIESMNDVVIVADAQGEIVILNEAAKRQFGADLSQGVPEAWAAGEGLFLADQLTRCEPHLYPLARALRGERVDEVVLWMRMPGWTEGQWHSVAGNPVRDENGQLLGAVNVGRDITVRKNLEEQVRQAALHDELTGILNRRGFHLLADQALRVAERDNQRAFVMFVDLDDMKVINDQQGHEAGDQALMATAAVLKAVCRASDVVARLGGDEFAVLAIGGPAACTALRSRILAAASADRSASSAPSGIQVSIGMAFYEPESPVSLAQLLAAADQAMYEAKRRRKSSRSPGA